jgi:hypothetical protein
MQSPSSSARTSLPRPSASTAGHITPTIILYGANADVATECEHVARELHIGRTEVRHLQAACAALEAHPKAMLVVSSSLRSWDRVIVEEHAARAGAPLRWVDANQQGDEVANELRAWVNDTVRRARAHR